MVQDLPRMWSVSAEMRAKRIVYFYSRYERARNAMAAAETYLLERGMPCKISRANLTIEYPEGGYCKFMIQEEKIRGLELDDVIFEESAVLEPGLRERLRAQIRPRR